MQGIFLTNLSQKLKKTIGDHNCMGGKKRKLFENSSKTQTDFCSRKPGKLLGEMEKERQSQAALPQGSLMIQGNSVPRFLWNSTISLQS